VINGAIRKKASGASTITTGANAKAIVIQLNRTVGIVKTSKMQIEDGSTATAYEPYTGRSITIDLGQAVYGGRLDVLTGILTVYPEYDSYNGEALTGRWISDRDVYAVGTTPTIGAQVVNIGAQGTEIQLEPHEVASLLGVNNIWADTGGTSAEYRADPDLYIQRKMPDVPVDDVQINGTSIVENGVANIVPASTADIKSGSSVSKFVPTGRQGSSVFYGLAKSAGDTTQSASSNAVGNYTDEAKIAIQKMLGIYQAPWELIREDTFTNAEASEYVISTDDNGEAFELTELVFLFETPKQNTESALGSYGSIYAHFNGGSAKKVECIQYTQAANASAHGCGMIIKRDGNLIETSRLQSNAVGNTMNVGYRYGESFPDIAATSDRVSYALDDDSYIWKIRIASVLGTGHYKLYGRRKWQ
jgi:hypothetical protein